MKPRRQSCWLPGSLFLFCLLTTSPSRAQIIQDPTLPNSSIVTPSSNTSVITGGTQAGPNLFHSFEQFSVPTGGVAYFNNALDIQNIISRVTGESVSNIDGLIRANGTANLFLLNPNGIIFGPNALLNIGGSFLASTASSINFADGTQFSATAPQTTPLLTVSVPLGLQYGGNTRSIIVQGNDPGTRTSTEDTTSFGLQVKPNQTLAMVGGDVALVGGTLKTAGGRIELGSVAGPSLVSLIPTNKGWALGYQGVPTFGDIKLSQQATVDASGEGGGDIRVHGRRVKLTNGSSIEASTLGSNSGGILAVTATDSVELSGSFPTGLFAQVYPEATGSGGNLTIEAGRLSVSDGATVDVTTFDSGRAGNLTIKTEQLIVWNGGQVLANTFGQGQAGNLTVQNATVVELVGGILTAEGQYLPSGLFTQVLEGAIGDGGNLSVSTSKLIVQDGAQVNSTTRGVGRAGDLLVRATDVELVGAALSADGKLLTNDEFGLPYGSGLFSGTNPGSRGDGGNLMVKAERLSLRDGAVVQTSTFSEGNAGDLTVQATDRVELVGTFADDRFPTSLSAFSGGIPGLRGVFDAKGRGGNLRIETGELIVRDRAAIAVSSLNPVSDALGAGNIRITAQSIRLDNLAKLQAATASGQGGDITLQVQDLLLLRRNSEISTTAGIEGAGGNGGNITIDNTPFIVAVPFENSDIKANAYLGQGGKVTINAQGIFGLAQRNLEDLQTLLNTNAAIQLDPINLPSSDITAISQTSPELSGEVTINTPDVDPSLGLVALPAELVDASGLIAQTCPAGGGQGQSEFIVTGRGGLPDNPSDTLSSDAVEVDLVTLNPKLENRSSPNVSTIATSFASAPIVEAQGWIIGANGSVVLTASAPTVTPHIPGLTPVQCHTPKSTLNH